MAIVLFIFSVVTVFVTRSSALDESVFDFLAGTVSSGRTSAMKFISFFGNHAFLIPANLLLLAYYLYRKNKWFSIRVGALALSSLGLMSLLKNLFRRDRPTAPLVDGVTNFSFPSGHAFMSVAFYGLLIIIALEEIKDRRLKRLIILFLVFFILLIGLSRVYLRLHYTTDVIAGFAAGLTWFFLCFYMIARLQAAFTKRRAA